jgi:DNA (cytosine-5)-methyltransferase 1
MSKVFRLGELYCGPGGLACGALRSHSDDGQYSLTHAWANDYDHDTCLTYRKNICPNNPDSVHEGDVRNLSIRALGPIDAFAYGFPCNSFSNVGEHQGIADAKFGQLYWYGIEVLNYYKPDFFIAENVSGIRSAGSGDFQIILNDMRSAGPGYNLTVNLYKAEQYGVPQMRHRVIIVGIRNDIPVDFHVPDPAQYKNCDISARTALSNIPKEAPNNEVRKLSDKVTRRLSFIKPGQNVWQAEAAGNMPQELTIKTRTKISQIYRKLDPNKPSYTLTASGGGGTFGYHWTNRELTNRERARIQTFPDDYEFIGKYSSVRKQIGMAVPCRLSEIVTTAVLNSFAGIAYPWVEANLKE